MPEYLFEKQKSHSGKWKIKIVILCTSVVLVSGIIIGVIYLYRNLIATKEALETDDVCFSDGCINAAHLIKSSVDFSQDLCDDFYTFTCGNYFEDCPSPYYDQKLKVLNKLNSIIAEPITGEEEIRLLQQKRFYQSCVNVKAIDEQGVEPFVVILEELGGWPVVKDEEWVENFNLSDVLIKCKELGLPYQQLFEISLNGNWSEIFINLPKMSEDSLDIYTESLNLNLMVETAVTLGATNNRLTENEMNKVLTFESRLKNIANNPVWTNAEVAYLDTVFPTISWIPFLTNITESDMLLENETIIALAEDYMRGLNLLLGETPKRVQANFIIWKIVQEFGFYLPSPIREYFLSYKNFMVSSHCDKKTRSDVCTEECKTRFPQVAEAEFIMRYVDDYKLDSIKEIFLRIKEQFINKLSAIDWIEESDKAAGINKVDSVIAETNEDDFYFEKDAVKEFLKVDDGEFFADTIIDMVRKKNMDAFKQQLQMQNITESDLGVDIFNNKILYIMSAVIEDDAYYDSNRPAYLNYAGLGSVIASKIVHDFGRIITSYQFQDENTIKELWINGSAESINELFFFQAFQLSRDKNSWLLNSKLKCAVTDMEDFLGIRNNGTFIMEMLANLIGVDIAYEAYMSLSEIYREEQKLPTLDFSPQQLFWMQYGAVNCHKFYHSRIEYGEYTRRAELITKAFQRYKITNALKNSQYFANDLGCPEGSVMNPIEKCQVL